MKYLYLLFITTISFTSVSSQNIIRTTVGSLGTSLTNETLVIQQTVGQPSAISFATAENGACIRQGFHHPFYFIRETGELSVTVYPNPNNGDFSFQVGLGEDQQFNYHIINAEGKTILTKTGKGNQLVEVSLDNPANGMYYLKVENRNQKTTFKILVNK
jgi:hypothetical protein